MKDGKPEKKRAVGAVQSTLLSFLPQKEPRKPRIFCDLDGVLVDFEQGVVELTGRKPGNSNTRMWPAISKKSNFYRHLAWTSDGNELWEAIRHLKPNILTGVSRGPGVSQDKFEWCKRELCVEVRWRDMAAGQRKHALVPHAGHSTRRNEADDNAVYTVITCWSANKHCECHRGDILIDDRPEKLQDAWERKGGIFIHHTSTAETLRILRDLKILTDTKPLQECDADTVETSSKEESTEEKCTTETDASKPEVEMSFDRESEISQETVKTDSTSATDTSGTLTDPVANS
jgi:hypothetical protein